LLTLWAIILYLVLIFEKLTVFPIYFFCDEAIHGVEASALLTGSAYSQRIGILWPKFFRAFGDYELSLSVYLHAPFVKLFGLNEFSVRLTTAVINLIGVGAVYVLIRYIFKLKSAWLTFPLFALSPIWFVHSRTGFQNLTAASFFLAFGACYLLAFSRQAFWIVPTVIFGAATFYTYTASRGWIVIALPLLLLCNLRQHGRYWQRTMIGVILILLFLLPYIHLHLTHPDIAMKRLHTLNTEQVESFAQRAKQFSQQYLAALNPLSWYSWRHVFQPGLPERHVIPPLPHLFYWSFLFAGVGFLITLWRIRQWEYRSLLVLLAAAPVSASLSVFNQIRTMPVGLLYLVFALIGVGWGSVLLQDLPRVRQGLNLVIFLGFSVYAGWFRNYVFTVAPYAYKDYGFYGVQMGAPEVYAWVKQHHQQYQNILMAHDLFNGGDIFIPFYLQDEAAEKTRIADITQICKSMIPFPEQAVYVVRSTFFTEAPIRDCPLEKQVLASIPDPKGQPLFAIVGLHRKAGFTQWFRAADEQRRTLQTDKVTWNSMTLDVEHSRFDIGNAQAMFDGNLETLARSAQINPAHIRVHLPQVSMQRITIMTPHTHGAVAAVKTYSGKAVNLWTLETYAPIPNTSFAILSFVPKEPVAAVTLLDMTFKMTTMDQYGFVHLSEITWE